MLKLIRLFAMVISTCFATSFGSSAAELAQTDEGLLNSVDGKHILVSQTQRWVAENRQVEKSLVEVAPSDRRLMIPRCASAFAFSYAFASSHKTIRAKCPETGWQIFLGVSIHETANALRYTRNINTGQQLAADDVESVSLDRPIAGLVTDVSDINGYSLALDVRTGDLVMQHHLSVSVEVLQLTRSVLAGEIIDSRAVGAISAAATTIPESQRLSLREVNGAKAARDLAQGTILSSQDLKTRHLVLTTQSGLNRDQPLTRANTALKEFYGKLPSDTLTDYSSIDQMQAIRNLPAGSLVRLSDLTPVNIIRKGENVQLTVIAGSLEISIMMLALENARLDQRVLLLNPESGEKNSGYCLWRWAGTRALARLSDNLLFMVLLREREFN